MTPAGYFDVLQGKEGWSLLWALVPLIASGTAILGIKFNYWGWKVLSPGDRAFRERFGKPKKYFAKSRVIFYIKHLNWIRMANVNPQTLPFTIRIGRHDVGDLSGYVVFKIKDREEMIRRAIYGMYDPNRNDLQNDERVAFVRETIEAAIGAIVTDCLSHEKNLSEALTLESLHARCGQKLSKRCGTKVVDFGIKPFAPTDAQIEAAAKQQAAETLAKAIQRSNDWSAIVADELITPGSTSHIRI